MDAFVTSLHHRSAHRRQWGWIHQWQDTADILTITNDGTQSNIGLFSSDTFANQWSSSDAEFNGVIHRPHSGLSWPLNGRTIQQGIFGTVIPLGKSNNVSWPDGN